ncbi:hypothetical protein HY643_05085 [Candidatus Woesearchaeota archaeon]|nr:hypothetical protein [Candidatus Woesearchaeota archaeon]
MGLENVFGKPEQVVEEKKLEVIASDESVVGELLIFFKKNKYKEWKNWDECKEYFNNASTSNFLKSFQISPKRIRKFNEKAKIKGNYQESFGLYLSALIQASYNQGFNDFEFKEIVADCFGAYLKGKEGSPIKIQIETLNGKANFAYAQNFFAQITNLNGDNNFKWAEDFSAKIRSIKGYANVRVVKNSIVEIGDNPGKNFGGYMKNCTIYSPNQQVLESIKEQIYNGVNNSFHLGRLPTKWD